MLIFSLANVLHQSLEPEDAAKVLLLHFCTILRSLLTDYLLFFCDHCPTVLPRWVQPGTLQCYISLRVFQREGPNTNDIDHHLVGRLTKFNLLPGARGCRGPRSNRIGEGSSWIIILSQRELCWTIMMILKYSEYDHIFHMKEGENEDNGDKACTCAVLRVSWPISKHVNISWTGFIFSFRCSGWSLHPRQCLRSPHAVQQIHRKFWLCSQVDEN